MCLTFLDFGFIGARSAGATNPVFEELGYSARFADWPPIWHKLDDLIRDMEDTHTRDVPHVPLTSCHSKPGFHRPTCDLSTTPRLQYGWQMEHLEHCLMLAWWSCPNGQIFSGTGALTRGPRGPRSSLTALSSRVEAGCMSRSRRGKRP